MSGAYASGPRVLAGAGAAGSGLAFGVLTPLGLLEQGYVWSAAVAVVTVLPLFLFLSLLAVAPATLQRLLRPVSALDLQDGAHVAVAVIMAGTLYFTLGFGALVNGVNAVESTLLAPAGPAAPAAEGRIDGEALFTGLTLNAFVLIVPAIAYVSVVHGGGPLAALHRLGLRSEGAGRATLIGFGIALGFILLLVAVSAAVSAAGIEMPQNDLALAIAKSVTVLGAFALAVVSSVSEEVFFRGFLQPRIGLLAQAVLFGLAHLSYVHVLEVVVTFSLGLAFGIALRRTGNLWAPIAAHFLFNLIMLLAGIYAPEEPAA